MAITTKVTTDENGMEHINGAGIQLFAGTQTALLGAGSIGRDQAAAIGAHLMHWAATGSFTVDPRADIQAQMDELRRQLAELDGE